MNEVGLFAYGLMMTLWGWAISSDWFFYALISTIPLAVCLIKNLEKKEDENTS